jgi:hypothetical protein
MDVRERLAAHLRSPRAFAGAAALGFLLGRRPKPSAPGAPARKGVWGWVGTIGFGLLQLRYGSPAQWVARAMSTLAR